MALQVVLLSIFSFSLTNAGEKELRSVLCFRICTGIIFEMEINVIFTPGVILSPDPSLWGLG